MHSPAMDGQRGKAICNPTNTLRKLFALLLKPSMFDPRLTLAAHGGRFRNWLLLQGENRVKQRS
jgi:hypothetical protein